MASSDRELKIIQSTTIQVPVCYKHLHLIREKVIDQASQAGLSETHCAQLEMAVDEACTNIIEHSYGGEIVPEADTPGLRVNFVQYLDRIVIEIYDHGAGFDFQRHRIVEPERVLMFRVPWLDDKGDLQIFPLARAGSDDESRDRFRAAVRELYTSAIHAFGGDSVHAEHRLTTDAGYGKTLATAGIVSEVALYMWRIGSYGAVPVVTSDPATGTTVLAIHVVPAEWEWTPWGSTDTARGASRARTMAKRCAAADPHWEWPA